MQLEILRIDTHTTFRLLACVHAGALLAFSMMVVIAPGYLRDSSGVAAARRPTWGWLGAFALLKSMSVAAPMGLGMVERMLPLEVFRAVHVPLTGAAWTFAFEFGLRWLVPEARWARFVTLVPTVCWAALVLMERWSPAALAIGWLAAVPAAATTALAAWRAGKRGELPVRPGMLGIAFAALGGLAALELFGVYYGDWFQGWTANTFHWFDEPAPFVPAATGLSLLLLAAWSWWMIAQFVLASSRGSVSRMGIAVVAGPAVGILTLSGFIVTWLDLAGARHNTAMRPAVYAAIGGLAARLEPVLAEVAPDRVWSAEAAVRVTSRLARHDMLTELAGTEGLMVWTLRAGSAMALVKVPRTLPSPPPVQWENAKLFYTPRPLWQMLARRGRPFTPNAHLDERGLHVIHSVPLGLKLPSGEALWLGLRQNFDAWDAYKREIYVQGLFTLALAGVVGGVFGIFLLRVRREHELELARDHAEAANHAKSEFIAFVSHELRTPLQSVLGYADILRSRPDHPTRREFLDALASQGRELLTVVNELLDFSAAEAGRLPLAPSRFAPGELVADCERTVLPEVRAKQLAWTAVLDPAVPAVLHGDRARLRQVLLNVIGNAVKFTDRGSVSLRVERVTRDGPPPSPAIALRFVVLDTGPGIPEHERPRLFEVFGRLHDKVRGGKTGSGLGLALSRKLCSLMGGTITLENRQDGVTGALAMVELPFTGAPDNLAQPEEQTAEVRAMARFIEPHDASVAPPSIVTPRPVRVLVAEDHPHVREVICEMLAELGCAVDTTDNGIEAAALARQHTYELVLLDTWMPGLNGMQVAREIQAAASRETLPWLIGISASSRPEDRAAAISAGMNDFLAKPVDRATLLAALQRTRRWVPGVATDAIASGAEGQARAHHSRDHAAFERESAETIASIADAMAAGDWQRAHDRTHYFENSAMHAGRGDIAAGCAEVDRAIRAADRETAAVALAKLRRVLPVPSVSSEVS